MREQDCHRHNAACNAGDRAVFPVRGKAACRGALAIAAAGLLASCGGQEAKQPPYVNTRDIHSLMVDVVEPQAQVYWQSAGVIVDEAGEHDLTPTTDEGWARTRAAAATVSELGNLLMSPRYSEGRGEDWMQFAKGLAEVGLLAEKTAIAKDGDAVLEVGGTMYNVCLACHQAYPPATPAQGGQTAG